LGRMSGRFLDLLRGLRTLRHLQALPAAQSAVEQAAEDYRSRTMGVLRLAFLSTAVLELFASIAIAMLALYLGMGLLGLVPWSPGEAPVSYQSALFILLLAPEFYAPLRQLGSDYHARAEAQAAVEGMLPILQLEDDGEAAHRRPACAQPGFGNPMPEGSAGAVSLHCHHLSVSDAGIPARLHPLRLPRDAGDRALRQGPRGSGTSSLLLRLAAPQATDVRLIHVLQEVGLWELLRRLPLQLNTPLGERGLGLSGGQLSRLALARLLLRDTPVWLLDEPLAHLDSDTARGIGELLERLSRGRTLLLVSHEDTGLEWLERRIRLGVAHD